MKIGHIILVSCIVAALAVLLRLGFWQLERLEWKEGLIARVESGLTKPPVDLDSIEQALRDGDDIEYRPVTVSGTFDHANEQHFYTTFRSQAGYHVYTPLREVSGRILMVNRGFVPFTAKEASNRKEGQITGSVSFDGLARSAPANKPNAFVFDNDLIKNVYHWKSLSQMLGRAYDKMDINARPFFVDIRTMKTPATVPGNMPIAGVTRITFSNSHLSYAVTWFGLAATLLFVGIPFTWKRIRGSA
ncbi:MAG: SURF1 family protein [Pseudomonadota bacterium]